METISNTLGSLLAELRHRASSSNLLRMNVAVRPKRKFANLVFPFGEVFCATASQAYQFDIFLCLIELTSEMSAIQVQASV